MKTISVLIATLLFAGLGVGPLPAKEKVDSRLKSVSNVMVIEAPPPKSPMAVRSPYSSKAVFRHVYTARDFQAQAISEVRRILEERACLGIVEKIEEADALIAVGVYTIVGTSGSPWEYRATLVVVRPVLTPTDQKDASLWSGSRPIGETSEFSPDPAGGAARKLANELIKDAAWKCSSK